MESKPVQTRAEVVICGAGIAGISTAYHLAVVQGVREVLLIEQGSPLGLTSSQSTECYRNWWPGPGDAMVRLMNRSIDLLEQLDEESHQFFQLSRRGYLYVSGDPRKIPELRKSAGEISGLGAGPVRIYEGGAHDPTYQPAKMEGFHQESDGADLILDPDLLRRHFPYLNSSAAAALHVRRAGWFSAQQLGQYLLEQARRCGVRLLQDQVTGIEVRSGRVQAVHLSSRRIETHHFVSAAGPLVKSVGRMLGIDLPVFSELHLKAAFNDPLGVFPRTAPLLIWTDPQKLPWTAEEQETLAGEEDMGWLAGEFPAGVHARPEGGAGSNTVLMLWEFNPQVLEPVWPIPLNPHYPEIVLKGLAAMLPGLRDYFNRMGRASLDGGYYTRTRENRPLIGPLPVEGAYLIGALSGFGLMSACAAGELLALHLTGGALPGYAPAFRLERYQDPAYLALLEQQAGTGQL